MTALRPFVHRFPVTLGLLFVLAMVAVLTNSHVTRLEPAWLSQLGFATIDLWGARWGRLFTSALVTLGGNVFWQALGMVILAVGAAEYLTGSKSALATFWGVHLATLVAIGALVGPALHWLVFNGASMLLLARDVGPSAGYFGALGLAMGGLPLPRRQRGLLAAIVFAALVAILLQSPKHGADAMLKLLADTAHVLAFPLGLAAWWLRGRIIHRSVKTAVSGKAAR